MSERQAQLAELERQNEELSAELERLADPDEVRRIARRGAGPAGRKHHPWHDPNDPLPPAGPAPPPFA